MLSTSMSSWCPASEQNTATKQGPLKKQMEMEMSLCKGRQIRNLRYLWHAFSSRHAIDVSVAEANSPANLSMQLPAFLTTMVCLRLDFLTRRYGNPDYLGTIVGTSTRCVRSVS